MACVFAVLYSMLTNGHPGIPFQPGRGIRQGDPISPYLYILCVEGLSSLINHVEASKKVLGFKVAKGSRPITHLFFAPDSILFCKENLIEWLSIQSPLNVYENT